MKLALVFLCAVVVVVGEERIVGGTATQRGSLPFMAVILSSGIGASPTSYQFNYCGGTRITSRHILTAAHCAVAVGDYVETPRWDLSSTLSSEAALFGAKRQRVVKATTHPLYSKTTKKNDVMVVELEADVANAPTVGIVGAATASLMSAGVQATTAGWGGTVAVSGSDPTSGFPAILRSVTVPVLSSTTCSSLIGTIDPTMVCAGVLSGGFDSCQGDSGGPLMVQSGSNGWVQIGIVSFGDGCAQPNRPGVYTNLLDSGVQSFISGVIGAQLPTAQSGALSAAATATATATPASTTATATPTTQQTGAVVTATPTATPTTTKSAVKYSSLLSVTELAAGYVALQTTLSAAVRSRFPTLSATALTFLDPVSASNGTSSFTMGITVTTAAATARTLSLAVRSRAALQTAVTAQSVAAYASGTEVINVLSPYRVTTAQVTTSGATASPEPRFSTAELAGIAAGSVAAFTIILILVCWCICKTPKRKTAAQQGTFKKRPPSRASIHRVRTKKESESGGTTTSSSEDSSSGDGSGTTASTASASSASSWSTQSTEQSSS
jgi:trypsin